MKKLLTLALALMMLFSLVACGSNGGSSGGGSTTPPASTDYFYDHYDFCEAWMMPDDGVYTGYRYIDPAEYAGNEAVVITVYELTDEQVQAYINKVIEHGYEHLIGDSYSFYTGSATAMIQIDKRENGSYEITIDPSI